MNNQESIRGEIRALIETYFDNASRMSAFVPGKTKVSVGWPIYDHREIISAVDSLLDLRISMGPKVATFENDHADYVGTQHGIAVNSGSSANLVALAALIQADVLEEGAEVIVPSATFTTVLSPILQNGLRAVVVDVEDDTYNIAPSAIEEAITSNTGLIMPVHSLGCPADMKRIMSISEKYDIPILEDCCEAHAACVEDRRVGSFGLVSSYSFFVAHNMTTGEGGMVMTSDDEIKDIAKSIREFGRRATDVKGGPRFHYNDGYLRDYDERYVFERLGYNVRMTDIAASLGIEQLKKLDDLTDQRIELATYLTEEMSGVSEFLKLPATPDGVLHSFYGYAIVVKSGAPFRRRDIVRFLEDHGIETRGFMGGNLAAQPAYRDLEQIRVVGDLAMTKLLADNAFFIGCHPSIDKDARKYVVDTFKKFLGQY
jgi:CDP-6-deoxy-D-xylo-4-hexulose-3-dehydrase